MTVIGMCCLVARNKGKYSRKEESRLVLCFRVIFRYIASLLVTHPLAYFYYFIILGGIVWNILGSCWIGAAFSSYSPGFSACYLVCVILSWISVIVSPMFVLFGTLHSITLPSRRSSLFHPIHLLQPHRNRRPLHLRIKRRARAADLGHADAS